MEIIEIPQPHDSLFKKGMVSLTVAKDFLHGSLPVDMQQIINWDTLRHTNRSYVKEQLKQVHTDLVFASRSQDDTVYVYCLIEHQSTPDPLLPFRIEQYGMALMNDHLETGYGQLPIVIKMCIYAGKQTPYPYSMDYYDCFENPELARKYMGRPPILIDLSVLSEEELARHGQADLLQILLKQGIKRQFLAWIKKNPDKIRLLLKRDYGMSGIYYMLGVEEKNSGAEIIEAIVNIAPEKKEEVMTAAQELRAEGRVEGVAEGRVEGVAEGRVEGVAEGRVQGQQETLRATIGRMYQRGLDMDTIADFTGLSATEVKHFA
ncbi:MAG: Rpn family recombination-promoting nuclease/putative transposase [Bacteroidota bacterium]